MGRIAMPPEPFCSRLLTLSVESSNGSVVVRYTVDDRPQAALEIRYPDEVGEVAPAPLDLIAAAAAIYLGSLALAAEVQIERPLPPALLADLEPVVEMLWDIRRWKDELPLGPLPQITAPEQAASRRLDVALNQRSSVLLWSGGKDSTLSLLTLRSNGYDVHPVHLTINAGVEDVEQRAVARLADELDEQPERISIDQPDFLEFTGTYAREWDRFPLCNRIPFGRDLLTAAVAVPFALARGAGCISLGHDNECRTSFVEYEGKRIPRNDLESAEGALTLERAISTYVHPSLTLLPPVGNLSELRILHDMFVGYGDLMPLASFCFWGDKCGRCAKCLRYYLADQVYGDGQLQFATNPLSPGACPELDELLNPAPRSTLFQQEVLLLLGRLAQARRAQPDESELERFREAHLARVEPFLDAWEAELLSERVDPQVPPELRPALADRVGSPE